MVPLLDRGVIRKLRTLEYKLLFLLLIAYPILVLLFEDRFKQKVIMRAIFSILGFIPMLLFGVSMFILVS